MNNTYGINEPVLVSKYSNSALQAVVSGANTRLVLDTTEFDYNGFATNFTVGNYSITLNKTGRYEIIASTVAVCTGATFQGLYLYIGGTLHKYNETRNTASTPLLISTVINGSPSQTIYMDGYVNGAGTIFGTVQLKTNLSIIYYGNN